MKKFIICILSLMLRAVLSLRYRVTIKGLEKLKQASFNSGGILFLPNHPASVVDPLLLIAYLSNSFSVRPIIVEYMYYTPAFHSLVRFFNCLPIPNFEVSSNSFKKMRSEQAIRSLVLGVKEGENFLIYPAGKIKRTALEDIAGASAVYRIVQEIPEVNIVLIRTKGLWGSRFSRALTVEKPDAVTTLLKGFKDFLRNGLFFSPRREVIIELETAPKNLPRKSSKLVFNQFLERWYNRSDGLIPQEMRFPGDSLVLVPYSIWDKTLPVIEEKPVFVDEIDYSKIPKDLQTKVIKKIAEIKGCPIEEIKNEQLLYNNLGLNSLDVAQVAAFLQAEYGLPAVSVEELTTVGRVLGIASGQIKCKEVVETDKQIDLSKWKAPVAKYRVSIAPGDTIHESFLNSCSQMGSAIACQDPLNGVLSYSQLKIRALILAEYIKKLPGEYVGILLPASVTANLLVVACQLAGKIPLMINWTVGARHLKAVVELSNVEVVLSAWVFLDRLRNAELEGIEDRLLLLEDIKDEIGLVQKMKAFLLAKKSTEAILKAFNVHRMDKNRPAVLLFTSGTESLPKGVPLSHENILSNQKGVMKVVDVQSDDIFHVFLPPFHSFGFTVCGLLPLLAGIRSVYSPDPTDGSRLAKDCETWGVTFTLGAPTFIKRMLASTSANSFKTVRMIVLGAEKTPQDLIDLAEKIGKKDCLVEGYGITECSPILATNIPGKPLRGVGKALPGVKLCIVHPETYSLLPQGQQGLILAHGPNIFSGYLNPSVSSPFHEMNGQNWYITGDLGSLDEEGYLTISGRLKRFIKLGAEMVSLGAVEGALLQLLGQKGILPSQQDGPPLAIYAKDADSEMPKICLCATFSVPLDEVNFVLREAGFSSLVKMSLIKYVNQIPLLGSGKINYKELDGMIE